MIKCMHLACDSEAQVEIIRRELGTDTYISTNLCKAHDKGATNHDISVCIRWWVYHPEREVIQVDL